MLHEAHGHYGGLATGGRSHAKYVPEHYHRLGVVLLCVKGGWMCDRELLLSLTTWCS
jgi:hypothetical protein